jgi:hypothetical protein
VSHRLPEEVPLYLYYVFGGRHEMDMRVAPELFRSTERVESKGTSVFVKFRTKAPHQSGSFYEGAAVIWPAASSDKSAAVLVASSRQAWDRVCVHRLTRRSLPVTKPSLTQTAMRDLLTAYTEKLGSPAIRVRSSSSRRWLVASRNRRQLASRLDFATESVPEAFDEAAEEGKWFSSIGFELLRKTKHDAYVPTGIVTKVHRLGYIRTNEAHAEFFDVLAPMLRSLAEQRYKTMLNRSRQDTAGFEPRPLVVDYSQPYFRDRKNNHNLIAAARAVPGFGYSVIHANPHIHMLLTDYTDGSSFDLYVFSESRMLVVPQMIATPSSIDRLLSGLSARFPEGRISDVAPNA